MKNTIEEALINVFRNSPNKQFALEDVRIEFQKYYNLSEYQKDYDRKYPQPRWHHEIRSILAKLVKMRIVKKMRSNCYIYSNS